MTTASLKQPEDQPWLLLPLEPAQHELAMPHFIQRHHLILTSSVQLTKCRLGNKWQAPGQINYVSSKMLGMPSCRWRPGQTVCAIWLVWEWPCFWGWKINPFRFSQILLQSLILHEQEALCKILWHIGEDSRVRGRLLEIISTFIMKRTGF